MFFVLAFKISKLIFHYSFFLFWFQQQLADFLETEKTVLDDMISNLAHPTGPNYDHGAMAGDSLMVGLNYFFFPFFFFLTWNENGTE